jgi:alpha-beta hydrolase superfamily lysophospholipase
MKRLAIGTIKVTLRTIGYGFFGVFIALLVVFVLFLENRPDLKIWHKVELDEEFKASTPGAGFEEYLELEKRLFAQLDKLVYSRVQPKDRREINRYNRGSLSDPNRWSPNWNRTYLLSQDNPKAGALLLHGMSDSPYSLRALGQRLHSEGVAVIGLRIPGHGTAPSGLVGVKWEDFAAAVKLAVRYLHKQIGDKPLYVIGYSNGGALATHYSLLTLKYSDLPRVKGIVLISPAIGVSPTAVLAVWQARLGKLLGLKKLAWLNILPEYDPFKYGSFAVNAGDQVYRLTEEIRTHLNNLAPTGKLRQFPPVLAFQSAVDATVSTSALVEGLFNRLPEGGHELVLFDINRTTEIEQILWEDPRVGIEGLFGQSNLPFAVSLVTNQNEESSAVILDHKKPGKGEMIKRDIKMSWPTDVYSLSHVSLPISPQDPLYGISDGEDSSDLHLGKLALRGERGVLQIPASDMLRMRWNPFYSYLERRVLEFMGLREAADVAAASGFKFQK